MDLNLVPATPTQAFEIMKAAYAISETVMLHGTRGIGKSDSVKQFATEIVKGPLYDIRLTQIEPCDLRGLPMLDTATATTRWFTPEFLPTEEKLEQFPGLSPRKKYGFVFDKGLPAQIAKQLLESTPRGGVLPVLQVTCLRLYLKTFTLASVLEEIKRWWAAGRSCFTERLEKLKVAPPEQSVIDRVLPSPSG